MELNLIKELRKKRKSLSEIADKIGRTPQSISFICYYYNLPNNEWTAEEKEILWSEYGNYSAKELSKKLNRTPESIRMQMSKQKRSRTCVRLRRAAVITTFKN